MARHHGRRNKGRFRHGAVIVVGLVVAVDIRVVLAATAAAQRGGADGARFGNPIVGVEQSLHFVAAEKRHQLDRFGPASALPLLQARQTLHNNEKSYVINRNSKVNRGEEEEKREEKKNAEGRRE